MTWADGTATLICELCGREGKPEDFIWYDDEVAICRREDKCKKRQEINAWFETRQKLNLINESDKSMTNLESLPVIDRNPNKYQDKARTLVQEHYNHNFLAVDEELDISDVFIVWFAKTLQNWKAVVATAVSNDGMLFEVTYNGDKKEIYLDVYVKVSNSVIPDQGKIETNIV